MPQRQRIPNSRRRIGVASLALTREGLCRLTSGAQQSPNDVEKASDVQASAGSLKRKAQTKLAEAARIRCPTTEQAFPVLWRTVRLGWAAILSTLPATADATSQFSHMRKPHDWSERLRGLQAYSLAPAKTNRHAARYPSLLQTIPSLGLLTKALAIAAKLFFASAQAKNSFSLAP